MGHCISLLRKLGSFLLLCVKLIRASPSSPSGNPRQSRGSLPSPWVGWPLICAPLASGHQRSILVEPLLCTSPPLQTQGQGISQLPLYTQHLSECQNSVPHLCLRNSCMLYETLLFLRYVRKPALFLSKQNWARRISEQPTQGGTLSCVLITEMMMIITNNC